MNKIKMITLSAVLLTINSYGYSNDYTYDEDYPDGNPTTQGCAEDAVTLDSDDIKSRFNSIVGKVELRYSSSCKTAWVRLSNYIGLGDDNIYVNGVQQVAQSEEGTARHTWRQDAEDSVSWSPMVDAKVGKTVGGSGTLYVYSSEYSNESYSGDVSATVPNDIDFSIVNHGFAINSHSPSNGKNVNLWSYSSSDIDEKFVWTGHNIKRKGTNQCLNAYKHSNGGNVNMWECSNSDNDQQWKLAWKDNNGYANIALGNTGYCLNAYNRKNGSNLNIWKCSANDVDQRFKIISAGSSQSSSIGDSCGTNKVYDCSMQCVYKPKTISWVGDGYCDDGTYGITLTCSAFNNDGGDCN